MTFRDLYIYFRLNVREFKHPFAWIQASFLTKIPANARLLKKLTCLSLSSLL